MPYYIKLTWLILILLSFSAYTQQELKREIKKEFYETGALRSEQSYLGDQLDGTSIEYYESGQIKGKKIYEHGKLISESDFKARGDLVYEMKYDIKGNKVETLIGYYPTGELHTVRTLVNGKQEGSEVEYYRLDMQKKAERNYRNGKKHGQAKGYHSNGNLQGDWEFIDGQPIAATIYYRTGEKWLIHHFEDGKLNGVTEEYDKGGHLIAERVYKDDKLIERRRVRKGWFF